MKIRSRLSILHYVFIGLVALVSTAGADIIYVDADSPSWQNGLSWMTAYHYLQDALNLATPGDEIRVAEGTYKPDEAIGPVTTGRTATFDIPTSITLKGGYAGWGHPDPNVRSLSLYETILSGDLDGDDPPIDYNDTAMTILLMDIANRQDNAYTVVTIDDLDPNTSIDGFTISGGNANGPDDWPTYKYTKGGGMWLGQSSIPILRCTFKSNTALDGGGALFTYHSVPQFDQCNFLGNFAEDNGAAMYNTADAEVTYCKFLYNIVDSSGAAGAVYNEFSDPYIANCTFQYNFGGNGAGAIYNYDSEAVVVDCLFEQNTSDYRGGAIINTAQQIGNVTATILRCEFYMNEANRFGGAIANYYGTPEIKNCYFEDNVSYDDGGAIYNRIAGPNITDCTFSGNTADLTGGAINNNSSTPRIADCKFIANNANGSAGAVYSDSSDPNLINCLFNGNSANSKGGAVATYDTQIQLINCTFSANNAPLGKAIAVMDEALSGSNITVQNCIVWNGGNEIYNVDVNDTVIEVLYSDIADFWVLGPGNIFADPLFMDIDGVDGIMGNSDDDLRLSSSSPCIDAGSNIGVPPEITTDLAGAIRFLDAPLIPDTGLGIPPIIDMGAYEFGGIVTPPPGPPVADAGDNQTVSADPNGLATVILDGTGSYDPNGLPLYYIWNWYIGPNPHYALGQTPTIQLPVGTHIIELTVTNGSDWSAPDFVIIEVTPAPSYYPATLDMWPDTVYRTSGLSYVIAEVYLQGLSVSDVNQSIKARIYPSGVQALAQNVSTTFNPGEVKIEAVFNKSQLLAAIPGNGPVTVTVKGKLVSTQDYQGSDTIVVAP